MQEFQAILVWCAIGVGIYFWWKNKRDKRREEDEINEIIRNLPYTIGNNFKPEKTFVQPNFHYVLSIDTRSKQLLVCRKFSAIQRKNFTVKSIDNPGYYTKLIPFNDLMKTEVNINGTNVSTKSRTGAAVGGLLFGTAGAIIGGSGGKTIHTKIVSSVTLTLYIKDLQNPTFPVGFLLPGENLNAVAAEKACYDWQNTIAVALAMN